MIADIVEEWKSWAERLSTKSLYYKDDFKEAASKLPEDTVKELGNFYERAARENHVAQLNNWLESVRRMPMSDDEKGIRNLVGWFAYIGNWWGYRPFTTKVLKSQRLVEAMPDWSKLPAGTEFLAQPAEWAKRFKYVFSEEGREHVQKTVTPEDKSWLTGIAEQIRRVGYGKVDEFSRRLGFSEHIEALMVYNLIGVLDALGLRYYDQTRSEGH